MCCVFGGPPCIGVVGDGAEEVEARGGDGRGIVELRLGAVCSSASTVDVYCCGFVELLFVVMLLYYKLATR